MNTLERSRVRAFVKEVNIELRPVLKIVQDKSRPYPMFSLCLRKNSYAMCDQVCLNADNKFSELINGIGITYFGFAPSYNNLGRIFWFI